jgi:hypothetical protein
VYERINNKTLRDIVEVLSQHRNRISQLVNREGTNLSYPGPRKT